MSAYYNEFDPFAAAWLRELIKRGLIADGEVDERSITDVHPDDLHGFTQCHFFAGIGGWSLAFRMAGLPDSYPAWSGSLPCQPWSPSGNQLGASDPRDLWGTFFWLLRERRPPVVLGEQVDGAIGKGWLDRAALDLEDEAYAVASCVLRSDPFGTDHRRNRLYWAAADATCQRQPEPWHHRQVSMRGQENAFREASGIVSAFRRGSLPFLCRDHDGLPGKLARGAIKGLGNAIVPQVAAHFIAAFMEARP